MVSTYATASRLSKRLQILRLFLLLSGAGVCPAFSAELPVPPGQLAVTAIDSSVFNQSELATLQVALGLKLGSPVDWVALDAGVRALGNQRGIHSIMIDGERHAGGVRIFIRGSRLQTISKITFENIDPEILEEVRGKIDIEEGEAVETRAIQGLRARVKEAYEYRGFYFAEIAIETKESEDRAEVELEIRVVPNEPSKISKITANAGSKEDSRVFTNLLTLRSGDVFSRAEIDKNIQALNRYLKANQYPTSKVDDAVIVLSPDKKTAEVTVMVRLEERYQFEFVNHKTLSEVELRNFLSDEFLVQTDAIFKISEAIENKYKSLGYHFCKVKATTRSVPNERLNIVSFNIDEGSRVKIDTLEFSSTSEMNSEQLKNMFFEGASGVIGRGIYFEENIKEATRQLEKRLRVMGFHRVRLSVPKAIFSEDKKGVRLFFEADLGPRAFFQAIHFTGNNTFPSEQLKKLLTFNEGDPLSSDKVTESKQKLIEFYRLSGYADVAISGENGGPEIQISEDGRMASVNFFVKENAYFTVGDIRVEGVKKTIPEVVIRELRFQSGDRFSPDLIAKSEEAIALLGLFSRIEIVASASPSDATKKDITVVLRETRPGVGEVGFGAAYEEPRFRLRSFASVAYRNLMGLNQTVSARGEFIIPISKVTGETVIPFIEYAAVLGYRAPYPFGIPVVFMEEVTFDQFEVQTVNTTSVPPREQVLQRRMRLATKLEKKVSDSLVLSYRVHQFERTQTESISTNTDDRIGSTGPGAVLDLRDDKFNPTKGSLHSLHLEFAHPYLGSQSNISFLMGLSRNSFYFPLFGPFSFAFSANVAYATSLFPGQPLPNARLRADLNLGGQGSIRGLSLGKLIPGVNTERTAYYNLRSEFGFTLFSNVGLALFADAGEIFPNLTRDPLGYGYGLGIGVRYKTPVGPIVFDVAQSFGPVAESKVYFYLTVGSI